MAKAEDRGSRSRSSKAASAVDSPAARVLAGHDAIQTWQEHVYRTLHQQPELSNQEVKTAAMASGADSFAAAFKNYFGDRTFTAPRQSASEDFSRIPEALGVP